MHGFDGIFLGIRERFHSVKAAAADAIRLGCGWDATVRVTETSGGGISLRVSLPVSFYATQASLAGVRTVPKRAIAAIWCGNAGAA